MSFDPTKLFAAGVCPAERPQPSPRFSFVGGNNDADNVPVAGLAEAAVTVLGREGPSLATYGLGGSPLGYEPLREFVAGSLGSRANTMVHPDDVLITSGSLQALDLVNKVVTEPGDVVIVEQATYGGMLSRLRARGVDYVGVELDNDGIIPQALEATIEGLKQAGRHPKYVYTIPTVQNPTGSVMPVERRRHILEIARRHGVLIFEDDCYADLIWDGERPPTIRSLDDIGGHVVFCGSFSKSVAPALRVGYLVADWAMLGPMLGLKTDAGSGALEQMVLAEYSPQNFDHHVAQLSAVLRNKAQVMADAVTQNFGDTVSFTFPKGGIFLWLEFLNGLNTSHYVEAAAKQGIQFNPGSEWSADPAWGSTRMRLCFGQPSTETISQGVALLAETMGR